MLTELLDDGTGKVCPALVGLLENLVSMPEPGRGSNWLRNNASAREYLRGLARGQIPLTHDGLHDLPSWRTAAHLRDLLMPCPAPRRPADPAVERWYRHELQAVTDPGHARLLRHFTCCPRCAPGLPGRPLTPGSRNTAANHFVLARRYLTWLASRDRQLPAAVQADIDDWYVTWPQPEAMRAFWAWAMATRRMPRLNIPARAGSQRAPISQHRRLALLNRFLADPRIPLRTRVAGCLLLLYAQPVTRLVRLTTGDVIDHDGQVSIRLGSPPTPVPGPFAAMLIELAANRANMNTAANPACSWLFPRRPVRRAGQCPGSAMSSGMVRRGLRAGWPGPAWHGCAPRARSACGRAWRPGRPR
jgi:hypothetical protein